MNFLSEESSVWRPTEEDGGAETARICPAEAGLGRTFEGRSAPTTSVPIKMSKEKNSFRLMAIFTISVQEWRTEDLIFELPKGRSIGGCAATVFKMDSR